MDYIDGPHGLAGQDYRAGYPLKTGIQSHQLLHPLPRLDLVWRANEQNKGSSTIIINTSAYIFIQIPRTVPTPSLQSLILLGHCTHIYKT